MTTFVFTFLSNPRAWIILFGGLVAVLLSLSNKKAFLVTCGCFAVLVSIVVPHTVAEIEHIPLIGPLELIRLYNRYLAILFGAALLSIALSKWSGRVPLSQNGMILLFVHASILGKNLFQGVDPVYSVTLFVGFAIVLHLFWYLITIGKTPDEVISNFQTFAIAAGLVLFALTAVQYRVNPGAMTRVGGRFHGLTSNPQMFVISFVPFIPVAYFAFSHYRSLIIKCICVAGVLLGLYWCYLTGSRLALLLICISFGTFFQMRLETMLGLIALGGLLLVILNIFEFTPEIDSESRIFTAADTRTYVWKRQLEEFLSNPVFGNFSPGSRVTFSENSWLGAAASLGLLGLVPMCVLAVRTIKLTYGVWSFGEGFTSQNQRSLVFSLMLVSFAGSIFEAFLFGVLTLPMIMFISTVFTMERVDFLTRSAKREEEWMQAAVPSQVLPVGLRS